MFLFAVVFLVVVVVVVFFITKIVCPCLANLNVFLTHYFLCRQLCQKNSISVLKF